MQSTFIKTVIDHCWDLNKAEAINLQRTMASKVIRKDLLGDVRYVAGVDVAYDRQGGRQFAAAVVLDANSLTLMESAVAQASVRFPYMPGLLAFRELPAILQALNQLKTIPHLIVCDGQGIAHPRRFGLASHLGVIVNMPTIGCGKTKLLGLAETPGCKRGRHAPLMDQDEMIGCVLRTQDNVKPVYVSIGHRISLESACHWILRLSPCYRLPETTRRAHQMVRKYKNGPITQIKA